MPKVDGKYLVKKYTEDNNSCVDCYLNGLIIIPLNSSEAKYESCFRYTKISCLGKNFIWKESKRIQKLERILNRES